MLALFLLLLLLVLVLVFIAIVDLLLWLLTRPFFEATAAALCSCGLRNGDGVCDRLAKLRIAGGWV